MKNAVMSFRLSDSLWAIAQNETLTNLASIPFSFAETAARTGFAIGIADPRGVVAPNFAPD
jgi:hypothetical protein